MSDATTKLTYLVGAKRLQEKNRDTEYLLSQDQLERFAALVAAAKEAELMDEVARLQNREWVGLTFGEICECESEYANVFARNIEAKLREKNHE